MKSCSGAFHSQGPGSGRTSAYLFMEPTYLRLRHLISLALRGHRPGRSLGCTVAVSECRDCPVSIIRVGSSRNFLTNEHVHERSRTRPVREHPHHNLPPNERTQTNTNEQTRAQADTHAHLGELRVFLADTLVRNSTASLFDLNDTTFRIFNLSNYFNDCNSLRVPAECANAFK